eukprot:8423275-Pyramimonas_sp.AAC.1
MERRPSSLYLRGNPLNLMQMYSPWSQHCAADDNKVDVLELCGGIGGISQLAFSRGLGKRTFVDLGNQEVQDAVMYYLDVCFVKVVVPQPNCRTT